MSSPENYYQLLEVPTSADSATLRSAFRKLSKKLHPDTTSLPADEASMKFQKVCEAYEYLNDPITRQAYDLEIKDRQKFDQSFTQSIVSEKSAVSVNTRIGERRPFSGGELFSLLLLGIALLLSLFLGLSIAILQGRDLFVQPSWLVIRPNLESATFFFLYKCILFP